MKALSICYITGQLGQGGAERQLFLLARELIVRGHHVTVVSLSGKRDDFWVRPLQLAGAQVIMLPFDLLKLQRVRRICEITAQMRVDVLHSWTFSANPYAAVSGCLTQVPMRFGSERSNHHFSRKTVGRVGYRVCLAGLDGLTTNTTYAAAYIKQCRPALPVHVVPNAVELPSLTCCSERARLRQEIGLSPNALAVAGVGSLFRSKNFEQLLSSGAKLFSRVPNLRIVLVGDGPERERLKKLAAELLPLNTVLFLGSLPKAADIMGAFDVVALPAVGYEGLPNVLIEAAAAGVPSIANDVGGCREAVSDGVSGFIVPEANSDAFTDQLGVLCGSLELRRRMGAAARQIAVREFSLDSMLRRMLDVYRREPGGLIGTNLPCAGC